MVNLRRRVGGVRHQRQHHVAPAAAILQQPTRLPVKQPRLKLVRPQPQPSRHGQHLDDFALAGAQAGLLAEAVKLLILLVRTEHRAVQQQGGSARRVQVAVYQSRALQQADCHPQFGFIYIADSCRVDLTHQIAADYQPTDAAVLLAHPVGQCVAHRLVDRTQGRLVELVAACPAGQVAFVGAAVEQHAAGGLAVAPGAARLLGVALQRFRHIVVGDEADVGLVYAHAEGNGGDDDAGAVEHEALLHRAALVAVQPGVVILGLDPLAVEQQGELLAVLAAGGVDDAAAPLCLAQIYQQAHLALGVGGPLHLVAQVGTEAAE